MVKENYKKIAVASLGKTKGNEISLVAGRSPYYLIFNDKKELIEVIKNPFVVGGGAGFGIAKLLGDEEVNFVVAGKFGDNMINALEERNIKILEMKGLVDDVFEKI